MKIVFVLPAYFNTPIGGYHVHYQYANRLSRKGHDVTIIFPRQLKATNGLEARLKAPFWALRLRLENKPLIGSFPLDARVKVLLLRDLSRSVLPKADVLIATAWQAAEALADAPSDCGRKFYIAYDYEHWMTALPHTRDRIAHTYRLPFGIIATSSVVAETVRGCGGIPIAQIPCGLDFAEFGIDMPLEQREPMTLGFPLRGETFKGAADAIEAASALRARYGERLSVTAFGSRRLANLPDWIEWPNYPSQSVLRRFYNSRSVFLVPSHFEGWGLPGIEAMACGAALVTADNGGCRDYAIDGVTALVVPPCQPLQLSDAVSQLFENDALRVRLARAGNIFAQKYTWQTAVDQLETVLSASR